MNHGLLYTKVVDHAGDGSGDQMHVRSYATQDNWETAGWTIVEQSDPVTGR